MHANLITSVKYPLQLRSILLICLLLPVLGYSQNTDSSARSKLITTSPRLGGITITDQVAPITVDGHTFTMQLPTADIGIPVYKNFSSPHPVYVRTGIRYQGLLLSNEKNIGSTNFHSLGVPLLFSYSLSRATSISLIGIVSVGSDFKRSIKEEDFLYTAGVRIGFHQNKSFKYGVTVTYVSNYAGQYLLPLPDVDWTISKKLNFTALLPARASLKYKLSQAQSLGVTLSIGGSMYRLNEEGKEQYLHLRQSSAGLIYDLKMGNRWKLNLVAGHTFMQRLETFNMDQKVSFNGFGKLNDRISNVSYQQNSFIFQTGISYQF
ncbi:hypothetical protein SAMN05428988_0825 [Chitinophaga sp. YR573]|uniref:DUF6268 family outer membrane beta-barrel protein n=1 Tax=Chitinophaga sp. YR573 TaxID=1881040 RepID=UPI0008CA982E|nr:DUF6268 family outer membrane beta-barrel protein [Chitinophaga sp. YR573]SEV96235.1 hypothetical protein SAMN05428988_0825 [Chitinophaga sp. YR573]